MKCTKILLYNLASLCEYKRLKDSVAVFLGGSCFDLSFSTRVVFVFVKDVYISAVNRHTQIGKRMERSVSSVISLCHCCPSSSVKFLSPAETMGSSQYKAIHLPACTHPSHPSSPMSDCLLNPERGASKARQCSEELQERKGGRSSCRVFSIFC